AGKFEGCRTLVVGHEAKVPDADKALRQDVKQEPADELLGGNGHHTLHVSVGVVTPTEGDGVAVESEQSMIGDGDAVSVTAEITELPSGRPSIHNSDLG